MLWCLLALAVAAIWWVLGLVLSRLLVAVTAVVAATLLTALLHPVVGLLVRWRLPRALAALATLLITLALLGGIGFLLFERVATQAGNLQQALDESGEQLRSLVLDSALPVDAAQLDRLPDQLLDALAQAAPAPLTGAGIAINTVTALALTLFLWFFMLKDGPGFLPWLLRWVPQKHTTGVRRSAELAWDVATRYVRGTVVIAFADAVGAGIVMAILGVPLTLSLSLLIFLGAFVPIVGSTVAGAVAVAVTLVSVGPLAALILLGAVIGVQQLEGNLLQPLVMGKALHLHPAAIVLAVTIGTLAAGILGALVSVPLYAIGYRIAEESRRGWGEAQQPDTSSAN